MSELDDDYIAKMQDVLRLYEQPYNPCHPVVCLDEKPVTLHADIRSLTPAGPGQIAKRDNEYKRCGTVNVFCTVEPKAGAALHPGHAEPFGAGVRTGSG